MTIEELQKEVGEWHRETFGDNQTCSLKRIGRKLLEESAEAYNECAKLPEDCHATVLECADVIIVALAIMSRCGISGNYAIRKKLDIVKARKYEMIDERGTMDYAETTVHG